MISTKSGVVFYIPCGVDIYPEFDLIPVPVEHVMEAVLKAESVRMSKTGRETWIVEIPAGWCRENTFNQLLWIATAILSGATAIGVYQIAEKEPYLSTLTSISSYGIMIGNGKIYYNDYDLNFDGIDDHDYYMMLATLCGVQYDILNDHDPDARMLSNAFGKTLPPLPL